MARGIFSRARSAVKSVGSKVKSALATPTGKSLIKVGKSALAGDVYNLEMQGINRLGKAIGKDNLRKGQAFGEKVMGKKNYQATAKGVKRGNRVGANAASMYLAAARGDPVAEAKYAGRTAEAAMGTQALRKLHGAVKEKIGDKNYNTLNNTYKGTRHGVTLGYNLAHLGNTSSAYGINKSAQNAAKMGLAGYHTAEAAHNMASHLEKVAKKEAANGPNKPQGRPMVTVPTSTARTPAIGGGSMKPKMTTY
jgi:hypothetical protein